MMVSPSDTAHTDPDRRAHANRERERTSATASESKTMLHSHNLDDRALNKIDEEKSQLSRNKKVNSTTQNSYSHVMME